MLESAKRLISPSGRSDVPPFMVVDVMAAAARIEAAGGRVIHMEVGQPAAPAPASAIAAARAALAGPLRYTESLGIPSLRARIARHYQESYGVAIDPARIAVTTGSSAGFILAFLALFEPGDRVAVALPGYPPYRHILRALGCEPVAIETTQATRWAITPDMLIAAHRKAPLKGVLIASPANPTGTMMTGKALRDLNRATTGFAIAHRFKSLNRCDSKPSSTLRSCISQPMISFLSTEATLLSGSVPGGGNVPPTVTLVRARFLIALMMAMASG